jgi:hypothetical protein
MAHTHECKCGMVLPETWRGDQKWSGLEEVKLDEESYEYAIEGYTQMV